MLGYLTVSYVALTLVGMGIKELVPSVRARMSAEGRMQRYVARRRLSIALASLWRVRKTWNQGPTPAERDEPWLEPGYKVERHSG